VTKAALHDEEFPMTFSYINEKTDSKQTIPLQQFHDQMITAR